MSGAFAYPDDQTRLQGGKCAEDVTRWDFLNDQGSDNPRRKPPDAVQESWDLAKQEFCFQCPILQRCRALALKEPMGVLGGLDQYERVKLRKVASRLRVKERATAPEPEAPVRLVAVPAQRVLEKRPFPAGDPAFCDGWTRDRTLIRAGWYMSQSPDGTCMRMKLKVPGAGVIKWLKAEDVDLRRPVTPVIGRCPHHKHETEVVREESAEGVSDRLSA